MYEDELNLRYYVRLLVQRWRWIAGAAFLAGLAAFALSMMRPQMYEATAAAAVVRSRTAISLDARVETLDDYELGAGRLAADRLTALQGLADSNRVMKRVLDDVGEQLSPEERNVRAVRNMINVDLTGDIIEFSVQYDDPELAALLANSVAQAYVGHVNQVYGASDNNVENITAQVNVARDKYDAAQQALQDYLADERQSTLSLTLEREINIKRALLDSYLQSRVAIETSDASASSELLTNMYTELKQIEMWLADAQTLREQVSANSGSFASRLGDTLALLMLRGRVYGGDAPIDLQMDLANAEIDDIRAGDVDNLIVALETRREETRGRIQTLSESLGGDEQGALSLDAQPLSDRIETLTTEITELESQLESELATQDAERRELEATRDREWEAYQALTNQLVEAEILAQSNNSEVRIADLALVPDSPVGSGLITNTVLAAIVAVMIAVGAIIFLDWWAADEEVYLPEGDEVRPRQGGATPAPEEPSLSQARAEGQVGD